MLKFVDERFKNINLLELKENKNDLAMLFRIYNKNTKKFLRENEQLIFPLSPEIYMQTIGMLREKRRHFTKEKNATW